jgi:hypothetical protein
MRRIVLMAFLSLVMTTTFAQKMRYDVIATCTRDMKTEIFGKAQPSKIVIERTGNSSVNIGGATYNVVSTDRNIDTDSIKSLQYTVNDASGKEFIVIFNSDIYNKVALMKYQVIFFDAMHPYDWTYYFSEEPKSE